MSLVDIKGDTDLSFTLAALYSFTRIANPAALKENLHRIFLKYNIQGNLIVATEGINGTIAGKSNELKQTIEAIEMDERFKNNLEIKYSQAECQPFYRMRLHIKPEIVTMGVPDVDPASHRGEYVEPEEWNRLIQQDDVMVIDTRNDYEVSIGTFHNAKNPSTKIFKEFPEYVAKNCDPGKDKKIAMFCTGGIRCEKASAYMKEKGFENVYHLKGGILKYLETVKEEDSLWKGECYVFDQRVSVKHNVQPGTYSQCRSCRMPLSQEDSQKNNPTFLEGIHCRFCVDSLTDKKRASLEERNRQIKLSAENKSNHLGLQMSDIKAKRSSKRKKLNHQTSGSLIVITRVHCQSATALVDVNKILIFVTQSVVFADKVLVLLGISAEHTIYYTDLMDTLRCKLPNDLHKVQIEIVTPWLGFTIPLNMGIRIALDGGFDYVLFQSLEVRSSPRDIRNLMSYFDDETLVVGPVLDGHDFQLLTTDSPAPTSSSCQYTSTATCGGPCQTISVPLRGRTCPWNTCAIWRLDKLGIVGFPLIGDGITTKKVSESSKASSQGELSVIAGGVEEVSAIAFAQMLNSQWSAKLVQVVAKPQTAVVSERSSSCRSNNSGSADDENESSITGAHCGGVHWNISDFDGDEERMAYHAKKMASKDSRPAAQMSVVGSAVPQGNVLHIHFPTKN
mmetsp:Transcript_36305/g.67641  ORF Transcript_36305/g.67641 Transcript_36305/m.67641 type:complete len:677 (+) Transcript_36305:79-2109(+)